MTVPEFLESLSEAERVKLKDLVTAATDGVTTLRPNFDTQELLCTLIQLLIKTRQLQSTIDVLVTRIQTMEMSRKYETILNNLPSDKFGLS